MLNVAWRGDQQQKVGMTMQSNEWKKHQEMHEMHFSTNDENSIESSMMPSAPEERMSLSLLRRRIRSGWYEDDRYSEEAQRLLFLRWLVREGVLSEWSAAEG